QRTTGAETPGKETPPMKEKSTGQDTESRPMWETLEAFARQGIQRLLQQLLEEEMEQVLGRRRYERRDGIDAAPGYRNGFGKPRRLGLRKRTVPRRRLQGRRVGGGREGRVAPRREREHE